MADQTQDKNMNRLSYGVSFAFIALATSPGLAGEPVSFTRDVRPILSNNCYKCHGPDDAARLSDVRLDTRDGLFSVTGGITPVVPRQLKASELYRRITSSDDDERMPPPESHKSLTQDEKDTLRLWIKQGAEWEPHWSFAPIMDPSLPRVRNARWAQNDICLLYTSDAADE